MNLYAYCENNPVYYVDPTGHIRKCVKKAYKAIRRANPYMPATKAHKLAMKQAGVQSSRLINPNEIRFSQSSVNGAQEIIDSMRQNGWIDDPRHTIDVVLMSDYGLNTLDNTRVLAARIAEIDVMANVHGYTDLLPSQELIDRFTNRHGVPQTWGDAIRFRMRNQNATFRSRYPFGADTIEWSGN